VPAKPPMINARRDPRVIRKYRESDREALKRITAQTFEAVSIDASIGKMFGDPAGTTWDQRKVRQIDADCDANPDGIFVYEEDGEVIGYLTTRLDEFAKSGGIPNMAVAPGQQGKGIGHQLLDRAFEYFRENGMELARIETLVQNEVGDHLYTKFGFKEVARQIYYCMRL
jgi:ribosomal protein S18 acetylase RimI-like enzyme